MAESENMAADTAAHIALRSTLAGLPRPGQQLWTISAAVERSHTAALALEQAMDRAAGANDFEAALKAAVEVALAAEALAASAILAVSAVGTMRGIGRDIEGATRAALGEAMLSTRIDSVHTMHHACVPMTARGRVEVDEPGLLPARYWRQAEPEPDKRAIAEALQRGPVPGARIAPGPVGARITNRKD